jgi:2-polyprenyl-3-methyl-5-hydroxy-6-metoxy-1,4-benzoquinol methylase
LDLYSDISRYYDSENVGLIEDFPAYELLADRFGPPVLDIGCGTGRITLHLAEQGREVVGVDSSESMLIRARERAQQQGGSAGQIEWITGDMREIDLTRQFGVAIFSFSGFMHLLEHAEQLKTLRRIAMHLRPGGGVAIDVANPLPIFRADNTNSLVVERLFIDAETGQTVMQQTLASFDRTTQLMSLTWVYDRIGDDGLVHRALVPQRVRYTLASEMRLLLQMAGFEQIEIYGDYEFNSYEEDSPRLFVVATKAGNSA